MNDDVDRMLNPERPTESLADKDARLRAAQTGRAGGAILGWLHSAISNHERVARHAASEAGGAWREDPFVYGVRDEMNALVAKSRENRAASIVHIAANDPESVLRRCATDRKLLELHGGRGHSCPAYDYDGDLDDQARFYDHEVCPVMRLLAEAYGWTEGQT